MRVRHTIIDTLFKMNEELTYKKIGSICDVKTGKLDANASDENGIYPFFTCSKEPLRINTYSYDAECVLIAGNGDLNVKYYNGKFDAYQRTYILTIKNGVTDVSMQYLYLFFQLYVETLRKNSIGGVIKYIKLGDITEANIPVPPLSTQSRIVSELDLLQSIIDKQKAQLKDLDNLAQVLFYDMFGDPVENEKGWEVKKIEEICSSIVRGPFGSALKKEFFVKPDETTYKVYEQKHAIQKNASIGDYYISEERFRTLKRFEVRSGDIIMSCSGTIGEFFEIPIDAEKGLMNQALLKFTLNQRIDKSYFLFTMEFVKNSFEKKGSGLQNIGSVGTVKSTLISLPPLPLQQSFAQKVESIERQKELINQSIREAQTLFDSRMEYYFGE